AKCGLGSSSTARRSFQLWVESQKEPDIRPNPIVEVGRPVSRVEMNAKNAPLTPASPHRRISTRFLRPRAAKIALTKPTLSYTDRTPFCQIFALETIRSWPHAGLITCSRSL